MRGYRKVVLMLFIAALMLGGCSDDGSGDPVGDTSSGDATDGALDTDGGDVAEDGADTDGGGEDADSVEEVDAQPPVDQQIFAFGVDPGQSVSLAPFPNDLYLGEDGVSLAPLVEDPVISTLGKEVVLSRFDELIEGREGFARSGPVFFFLPGTPDLASFEGRVHLVTLAGPEAGRVVDARVSRSRYSKTVVVAPAWGEYMMPDSQYGVLIESGVTLQDGTLIEAAPDFGAVLAAQAPSGASAEVMAAREVYGPLREWLLTGEGAALGKAPEDFVVGTVFTTEPVLAYAEQLFASVDAASLVAPTRAVSYDPEAQAFVEAAPVEGAGLSGYFGEPEAPFEWLPGAWDGSREYAALMAGGAVYEGGSLYAGIGKVINGSIIAPAYHLTPVDGALAATPLRFDSGGALVSDVDSMIPFTLFLCEEHVADPSNLPVAVFSHGGSVSRSDGRAFAVVNCLSGVATITIDMLNHGGRAAPVYLAEEGLVAPAPEDVANNYTGLEAGDAGFVPDHIGDNPPPTVTVGVMFALPQSLDPAQIEANVLTVALDTYTLVRHLRESDWSQVEPGLSFDPEAMIHQGLSFGTGMNLAMTAMRGTLFKGHVMSVVAGDLTANLMMAPGNAQLAATLVRISMGLPTLVEELQADVFTDFTFVTNLWLHQRADPLSYAPYLLRHRQDEAALSILHSSDTWDETLHNGLQVNIAQAIGFEHFTSGPQWSYAEDGFGADELAFTAHDGSPITANVTYNGVDHTAVNFFYSGACHAQVVTALCIQRFEAPYPPLTERAAAAVSEAPTCALQQQVREFQDGLLGGATHGSVGAPRGTCEDLYGAP